MSDEDSPDDDELPASTNTLDTLFSFAHESLDNYLVEEEDSDRIESIKVNSKYATSEKSAIPWSFGFDVGTRDYETRNLDNETIAFKTRIGRLLPESNPSPVTQNLWLRYREKHYYDLDANSFSQRGGKYTAHYLQKGQFKVTGSIAFDDFEYFNGQSRSFSRFSEKLVGRKFFHDEKIRVLTGYKREDLLQKRTGRKKDKDEYQLAFRWNVEKFALQSFRINTVTGYRDAKDEDGDDKDLDFKMNRTKARVDYRISDQARFYHSLEYLMKEYRIDSQFDHHGFELIQGWKVTPVKTSDETIYFNIVGRFKKINYTNQDSLDFWRSGISLEGTVRPRGGSDRWKAYGGLGYDYRNQRDAAKDRNNYSTFAGAGTELPQWPVELGLSLEYSKWDFLNRGSKDIYRAQINLSYRI